MRYIGIILLLWASPVWANCVSIDLSSISDVPLSIVQGSAYALAYASGHDEVPKLTNNKACVDTFDATGILDGTNIVVRYQQDEALRQSAASAEIAKESSGKTEINNNAVCQATLATIDAQIDSLSTVAQLRTGLKIFARCFVALRDAKILQ